jgi:hypothetical protein
MTVFKVAVMSCDVCNRELNLGTAAFDNRTIRQAAKDLGWKTLHGTEGDRSWEDVCPECRSKP